MIQEIIEKAFKLKDYIVDHPKLQYTLKNDAFIIYRKKAKSNTSIGLFKENNAYKLRKMTFNSVLYKPYNVTLSEKNILRIMCNVKVKSFEDSARLFGYKPTKEFMMKSEEVFTIESVLPNYQCKKDDVCRDVVEVLFKDKALKFLASDLEFIFPKVELLEKGYTEPKNREIKRNSVVRLINNKHTKFKRNQKLTVESVFIQGDLYNPRKYCRIVEDGQVHLISMRKLRLL